MSKKLTLLLLGILCLTSNASAQTNSWQSLFGSDTDQPTYSPTGDASIATDNGGTPYIAFIDNDNQYRVTVRKHNGTNWETVGAPGISEVSVANVCLAFDGSIPYVAYIGHDISVKTFDGTTWNYVGTYSPAVGAYDLSLTVYDHIPYVMYREKDTGSVVVQKFDGTDWLTVTREYFLPLYTGNYALVFDGKNPWIAYEDYYNSGKITIKRYDGNEWVGVGVPENSSSAGILKIGVNNGVPYIAYNNPQGNTTIKKFNGTVWASLGQAEPLASPISNLSFAFKGQVPYIIYRRLSQASVVKFNGQSWVAEGTPFASENIVGLTFGNNEMYAIGKEFQKLLVRKLNGANWQLLIGNGISAGLGHVLAVESDYNQVPYALYSDYDKLGKLTLMEYNGLKWDTVGKTGFSAADPELAALGFTHDNKPVICYFVPDTNFGASHVAITKYNNGVWETVGGSPYLPSDANLYPVFAAVNNGIPYVLYRDESRLHKLTLKKFNGSVMETVGAAGFSLQPSGHAILVFNNNIPYVAYTGSTGLSVMKFDGTNWGLVGNERITNHDITKFELEFNNGVPYVAYLENNKDLYVKKLTGNDWKQVGTTLNNFSNTYYDNRANLFFGKGGTPFLAMNDRNKGGKISVYKFAEDKWAPLGSTGFSAGQVSAYTFIYNNRLHVVYSLGKVYQKFYDGPFEEATPNTQASNINVTEITTNQSTISWKNGSGTARVVFVKNGTDGEVLPINGTTYTANTVFKLGSQIGTTGWYCIYNGTNSNVIVTGLQPGATYRTAVIEYDLIGGSPFYTNTEGVDNPANFNTVPTLLSLVTAKGTLSPAFSSTELNYSLKLPLGSTSIKLTPATQTDAVITVRDRIIENGVPDSIAVTYGDNIIPIIVTMGNQTNTYNITVRVGRFAPQINFATLPVKTYGDAAFEPVSTSENTGTPVMYASSDNQVAQIINGKVKIVRDGTVRITASQAAGNGYDAAAPTSQILTVNKAQLIVKAKDKNRTYGTANGTLGFTYTGFVNGDTQSKLTGGLPVANVNANASSPVGTYEITPVVSTSYFYELVPEPGTLTVTKAPLTVTTVPATRFYGAANPVIILKYTGFVNNDGANKLTLKPVISVQPDALSLPGRYAVNVSGGMAQNYEFTYVPGTLTINKGNLFITAKSRITTYGAAFPSLVLTYSGLVNGEKAEQAFAVMPVVSTTATAQSSAGTYPITVTGGSSAKYVLYYNNGTYTISKAVLQVTARNQTREQYQSNPEFTLRYSGFVNGDTESTLRTLPQGYTTATQNSPVGKYAISASGGYSPYYTFNYTPGVLTVTKAVTPSFATLSAKSSSSLADEPGNAAVPDDIIVHNAVSPNGDGQNDFWQIENIEKYAQNQVMVLTNAGALVYEARGYDNYSKRFEGYSSGSRVKQQPGTYMYVINYLANGEQKKKMGYIVIK